MICNSSCVSTDFGAISSILKGFSISSLLRKDDGWRMVFECSIFIRGFLRGLKRYGSKFFYSADCIEHTVPIRFDFILRREISPRMRSCSIMETMECRRRACYTIFHRDEAWHSWRFWFGTILIHSQIIRYTLKSSLLLKTNLFSHVWLLQQNHHQSHLPPRNNSFAN